jgi:putative transposase
LDFGLKEFGVVNTEERLKRYRRYVYEAGAVDRSEKGQRKVIDDAVVKKEQKREYEISRIDRFRYRTRYFTDSGVIGSKEFVSKTYMSFRHVFHSRHEKKPKAVKGLEGMFSLKRLSEAI